MVNRTERLMLEMSPIFYCLISRDMDLLQKFI